MCQKIEATRWRWKWVLVWFVPFLRASWLTSYHTVFEGAWPSGTGSGQLLEQAGIFLFWAVPCWTIWMMIALPFSGWRRGMLVAFGVALLLEIVFWRELLAEF